MRAIQALQNMDLGGSCPNLISELPLDIIQIILTKLPITEAVKTCMLSRSWRHKWTTMTHILFDERIPEHQMVRFINGFLSKHVGPIQKFVLCANYDKDRYLQIYQWLPHVCQKDVEELTLRLGYYSSCASPDCIFSCKNLTRLELYKCRLRPPPSFAGFSRLKHLVLGDFWNLDVDVERLVSSCPLLESLTLLDYICCSELALRAPNLKCLNVQGTLRDICLENTPLLVDITFSSYCIGSKFEGPSRYNSFEKLLGAVPKLERLCGRFYYPDSPTGSDYRRSIIYKFLKHVEQSLAMVEIYKLKDVLVALHMIFSFPNLKELHIVDHIDNKQKIEGPFLDYCKYPFLANRMLNQLEQVKITGEIHNLAIVKLIEFLLDRSPSLVRMFIKPTFWAFMDEGTRQLLSSFRGASQKASIFIYPGHDQI